MQSARKLFRSASRRIRRVPRASVEETDTQSNPQDLGPKTEPGSSSTPVSSESVLGASELAAAAAKLSDLDSSVASSTEEVNSQAAANGLQDCIDQLLIKQRRELMHELGQIKDSHRPVSKGDQRRNIDRFLRQHLHGEVSDSTSEGSNEGSNQSPRRRRRNGVVVQELEGLSRQQSVTQRLQCATFRRDLENMVRSVVVRQEREVQAALRLRSAGLPGNRRLPLVSEAAEVDTVSQVSGVSSNSSALSLLPSVSSLGLNNIPAAPPLPPAPGQHHIPPPPPLPTLQHAPQVAPAQPQQAPQQDNRWPMPTAPWLVQNSVDRRDGPPSRTQVLQQVHREAIVSEISELVHRQLVHETLESDFRGQLEFLMRNRLESIGPETGERVMNFINTIPQSQHIRRNDFSHLGIHVPTTQQEVSAGAVGGAAVPAAFMHEMDSLKAKMTELHEMVRMSMEMQLDLQRAIRQEVSAALHQQNGTTPSPAAPASSPASEGNCIICLDKEVDAVLYQCGHMCVCLTCGLRLSTMGSHCPMCRAPIRDVIRAYRCQRS